MLLRAIIALLLVLPSVTLSQDLLDGPEGVAYDSVTETYYVANWRAGVVKVSRSGEQMSFGATSGSCMGVLVHDNLLWVTHFSPIALRCYDLASGDLIVDMPVDESIALNGIAADPQGNIYIAGQSGTIYTADISEQTYDTLLSTGSAGTPQVLAWDETFERLILAGWGGNIVAIDPTVPSASVIRSTGIGQFVGMTRDGRGGTYLSSWTTNTVYYYDSLFSSPPKAFSIDHDQPTGLSFDPETDVLAIANFGSGTLDFRSTHVTINADTSWGWMPLEVMFSGQSQHVVTEWVWDFGDGDTAVDSAPSHIYNAPGQYDVSVQITTEDTASYSHTLYRHISVLADSLVAAEHAAFVGDVVEMDVNVTNNVPLHRIVLPIEYSGEASVTYVDCTVTGCRNEDLDVSLVNWDPNNSRLTLTLVFPRGDALEPGSGPVVKLLFALGGPDIPGLSTVISLDGYGSYYQPKFFAIAFEYTPRIENGTISISPCCLGDRGNVILGPFCDYTDQTVDIGDLTALIDYLFISFRPVCCPEEADVSPAISGGEPDGMADIGDLTALIDYLFISYPPLPGCP